MKIAINISGHIRSYDVFKICIDSFYKNIIDCNPDCEFYFYATVYNNFDWRDNNDIINVNELINILDAKYSLTDCIPFDKVDNCFINDAAVHNKTKGETVYNMYRVISMTNELLKKDNIKFDAVLRVRPDLRIDSAIKINDLNLNNFNVFNSGIVLGLISKRIMTFTDFFCISNLKNMNYYQSLFNCFYELMNECKTIRPETMLCKYLQNSKKHIDFIDVNYVLQRDANKSDTFWKGIVERKDW